MTEEFGRDPTAGGGAVGIGGAPVEDVQTQPTTATTPQMTEKPTTETLEKARTWFKATAPYRYTGLGGRDEPFAICWECKTTLRGDKVVTGKTHGKVYFVHRHPLAIVVLTQSNRGNRGFYIENSEVLPEDVKKDIEDIIEFTWIMQYDEDDVVEAEVEKYLKAWRLALNLQKKGEKNE